MRRDTAQQEPSRYGRITCVDVLTDEDTRADGMTDYLLFAILGLGSGAVVSFIALGIVLGYRGPASSTSPKAAWRCTAPTFSFGLRTEGRYLLPVPGLPGFLDVGPSDGLGIWPSLAIALATAVLLGLIAHVLVFRPLRNAPTLAKVVASIGLMLALQSIAAYRFGTDTRTPPTILPTNTAFKLSGVSFPRRPTHHRVGGDRRGDRLVGSLPVHSVRARHPRRGRE